MAPVVRFNVIEGTDAARLFDELSARARLERDRDRMVERVVYETFDWRFRAADSVLEHCKSGDDAVLVWRSLSTGETLGQIEVDEVPSFVWHLPDAPMVDRLARITDVRALLPLVTLRSRIETRRLVDDEGKTLARLTLDRAVAPKRRALPPVVELSPVRGYDREAEALGDLLRAQVSLVPASDDVVTLGLRAAGFAPGSYSSKLRLALDASASAYDTWITVLRELFAVMQANEAGLRNDTDSEFLHDYRVAVRRTRSVLADAKDVFAPDVRDWARDEFRWIGQITSPPRDADVFVLTVPEFEAALPAERRDDLKAFGSFLEDHRRHTHDELVLALDTDRARELTDRWRDVLDAAAPPADVAPLVAAPAVEVAGERIAKAHRRVIRAGRAIGPASHPEELHDLRKDAKRLRYLLECFGSLYPTEVVAPVIRELKGLQDVLGNYQDAQVQAEAIEHFGQDMIEQRGATASTLLAMGSIVEHLDGSGRDARDHFAERFSAFDVKAVRRNIDAIATSSSGGREDQ
jgi:CHAD domain-containing protein